jgi:Cu/Ag efflux pump CusA
VPFIDIAMDGYRRCIVLSTHYRTTHSLSRCERALYDLDRVRFPLPDELTRAADHGDTLVARLLKQLLRRTVLRVGLDHPVPVLAVVLVGVVGAAFLYVGMGKDFLPAFREETALIAVTSAPGTSLEEMNRISDVIETLILSVPEVRQVGRRLGRAERGDHVVPVSTAEFDVDFRDLAGHERTPGRSRAEILADLRARLRVAALEHGGLRGR